MKDLKKELESIIEEHLPKQLGETLQKRLTDLEGIEDKLSEKEESLKSANAAYSEKFKETEKLKTELSDIQKQLDEFRMREVGLVERENNVRFVELERDLIRDRLVDIKELTNTVFRNSVVRKSIFINEKEDKSSSSMYDNNGTPICNNNKTTDITETHENDS